MNLSVTQMAHAIALAATSIGGMAISADTSCAREYHAGCAASAGMRAVLAAARGFTAELAVLEHPRGFFAAMNGDHLDDVMRDLGLSWDIVTDMAIKLMPGAHPFHATAEAAADAARGHDIKPEDIDHVIISAAVQWTNFKGDPHPRNLVDAAHSLVYFVAAAIVDDGFDWQHMDPVKMADPNIAAVQDKVVFDPSPEPLPDRFPHRHGGTVTIRLKDDREFRSTCRAPRGSGPRGIEWADVDRKYRLLAPLAGLSVHQVESSLATIKNLQNIENLRNLTASISVGT
jgi:2-methylcitrate dehydratase PrpD